MSNPEIENIFDLADEFLSTMSSGSGGERISGRLPIGEGFILSTLFYEPSTRTRFSFESAMQRLGGNAISLADPLTSSAAKGETLADTVRVIQNYADVIVIRHPWEGAARVAADYADIPVINAGDGGHEHPTQTLCDLYTLRRENKTLQGLKVMIRGDLKNGRTVHSLVYGLARFGAEIIPYPAKGMELPSEVTKRLQRDFHCSFGKAEELPVDVIYSTPDRPHQLALLTDYVTVKLKDVDVCYVTRLQVERSGENGCEEYPVVDKTFLKDPRFRRSRVLHPLPRVEELGYDMDADPRGIYFKQAANGVPVRMALLAALLEIKPRVLSRDLRDRLRIRSELPQALRCSNQKCISNEPAEKRHLTPEFWFVVREPVTLRCVFCEREYSPKVFGNSVSRNYSVDPRHLDSMSSMHWVFFQKEGDAVGSGFKPYTKRRSRAKARR